MSKKAKFPPIRLVLWPPRCKPNGNETERMSSKQSERRGEGPAARARNNEIKSPVVADRTDPLDGRRGGEIDSIACQLAGYPPSIRRGETLDSYGKGES